MVSFDYHERSHWLSLPARFAMERTSQHISIWFWARNNLSVPEDVKRGDIQVNPTKWVSFTSYPRHTSISFSLCVLHLQGVPTAYFPNTDCDLNKFFSANNLIINLTLCGLFSFITTGESFIGHVRRGLGRYRICRHRMSFDMHRCAV